jgi:hypothetical protein
MCFGIFFVLAVLNPKDSMMGMNPPRKVPWFKRFRIALVVGLLVLTAPLILTLLNPDEALRKPTGFLERPTYQAVEPEKNGLAFFEDAVTRRDFSDGNWHAQEQILKGKMPWDEAIMQPLLDVSPPMKSLMEQALLRPEWYLGPPFQVTGSNDSLKKLQRILTANTLDLTRKGDRSQALQWLTPAAAITAHYQDGTVPHGTSQAALGLAGKIASLVFDELAPGSATDAELSAIQHILDRLRVTRQRFLRHIASGYWHEIELRANRDYFPSGKADPLMLLPMCCDAPRPPDWWIKAHYQPKAEQNLLTDFFTKIGNSAFAEGSTNRKALANLQVHFKPMSGFSYLTTDSNLTGRVIASGIAMRMLDGEAAFFAVEALRRCRMVVIAAKRWSLAHGGSWPATLTELVPDYLPEIPLDPYDGKPLRWDQPSGTAYVIGDDGVADLPNLPLGKFSGIAKEGAAARLP